VIWHLYYHRNERESGCICRVLQCGESSCSINQHPIYAGSGTSLAFNPSKCTLFQTSISEAVLLNGRSHDSSSQPSDVWVLKAIGASDGWNLLSQHFASCFPWSYFEFLPNILTRVKPLLVVPMSIDFRSKNVRMVLMASIQTPTTPGPHLDPKMMKYFKPVTTLIYEVDIDACDFSERACPQARRHLLYVVDKWNVCWPVFDSLAVRVEVRSLIWAAASLAPLQHLHHQSHHQIQSQSRHHHQENHHRRPQTKLRLWATTAVRVMLRWSEWTLHCCGVQQLVLLVLCSCQRCYEFFILWATLNDQHGMRCSTCANKGLRLLMK